VDHIYGVAEVGGTSVLLLSDVSFDSLGYRTDLLHEPLPQLTWNVLHKLPKVVGVGGILMSGIWWITKRRVEVQRAEREEKLRQSTKEDSDA
jgi:formate dehydrogenase iron-sulfur subunit